MKNSLLFFGLLLSGVTTQAQGTLSLTEFGFDHAYCRLFGYQTRNGVVFAAASGGVPDYTYLWTNLNTGEEFAGTTWGGLSPAHYEIMVTDSEGSVLKDTIFLDSLNPIADFAVTGPGVSELDWGYIGVAPVEIQYENTSQYFANPNNPLADTFFSFGHTVSVSGMFITNMAFLSLIYLSTVAFIQPGFVPSIKMVVQTQRIRPLGFLALWELRTILLENILALARTPLIKLLRLNN